MYDVDFNGPMINDNLFTTEDHYFQIVIFMLIPLLLTDETNMTVPVRLS